MCCNRCQKQITDETARYIYYLVLCEDCALSESKIRAKKR